MPISERHNPSFSSSRPAVAESGDRLQRARERLIVALDVPDAAGALALVNRLEGNCRWFKVGMELFTAAGPAILEPIIERGHAVFLDLKFHDIPNTVAGAVRSSAALGVRMLTVHAGGGPAMLAAALKALDGVENPPQLLAVTVLTSMDGPQLGSVGLSRPAHEQVELLARMGVSAGVRGFVCSPEEVENLREITGPEGVLVIPGIRPAGAAVGDQKRIATPADALRRGASYLVVGRPITQADDPAEAAEAIVQEMAEAL
jgi:orotidine-5'-phosphate decarboxylase